MEKIIEEYLSEQFHYYKGEITFSCPVLSVNVLSNGEASGYFELTTNSIMPPEFFIRTNHKCIQVQLDVRYGMRVRFAYQVSMKEVLANSLKGEITFTTNMGEYMLPYEIIRQPEQLTVYGHTITTMEEYVAFAKKSFKDAVAVFYTSEGRRFFSSLGEDIAISYGLFAKEQNHAGNVDSFLVHVGAKEPMVYEVLQKNVQVEFSATASRQMLCIRKKGYGYSSLTLSAKGGFIELDRLHVTDECFLGDESEVSYRIDPSKLHTGVNEGILFIESNEQLIEVAITVTMPKEHTFYESSVRKKAQYFLLSQYISYRLKEVEGEAWFEQSLETIEEILDENPNHILARLFQVQLLLANYRRNEARLILNPMKQEIEEGEGTTSDLYGYYLYLSTLLTEHHEEIDLAASQMELIYEKKPSFFIAWLLCYMKQAYQENPKERLRLLTIHGEQECNSPVLYLEVLQLYNQMPLLLEELSEFNQRVIYFGIKHNCVEHDLLVRVEVLAVEMNQYSRISMAILKYCYEKEHTIEILETICHILISENLIAEEFFTWYALGVDLQVRVTNIYEHYMMAMKPEEGQDIAKQALMYFAYSNQLPYEQKTYLYLYVLQHEQELLEVMDSYTQQIEAFVIEQVKLGRMNSQLVSLYQMIITSKLMTRELAEAFVQLLFQQEITIENHNVKQIIVVHEHILNEAAYPVVDGKAVIKVYHKDAIILLEAYDKTRTIFYDQGERNFLLLPSEWYQMVLVYPIVNPYLDWYLVNEVTDYKKITLKNVFSVARLIANPQVSNEWKKKVRKYLATFYYENDMIEELDGMIGAMEFAKTDEKERVIFMQYIIKRGLYELAYEMLRLYGTESHEPKTLVRLCKRLLSVKEEEKDAVLLDVAYYIYKNKAYDRTILRYLNEHYDSNYYAMRDVYHACMQQGVQAPNLARKLLVRILLCKFNECDNDMIYSDYKKLHADDSCGYAYLKYHAMLYLADERPYSAMMIEDWTNYYHNQPFSHVIGLALLKFFATRVHQLKELEQALVETLLRTFFDQKMCFPFFTAFRHINSSVASVCEYTMISYRATMSEKVIFYYTIHGRGEEVTNYERVEIQPMIGQFYMPAFVLFKGDELKYYFAEEVNEVEVITEEGMAEPTNYYEEGFLNRYAMLHAIHNSYLVKEYQQVITQLQEYDKKQFLVEQLFKTHS